MGLGLHWIANHVLVGVANTALNTQDEKLFIFFIYYLEHDHVLVGEGLADVAEDDHVRPGALAAGGGGEAEVVVVQITNIRHNAAANILKQTQMMMMMTMDECTSSAWLVPVSKSMMDTV